ncbi:hypothetical protein AX17_007539 [Amanita inopinata Kibby_2008]|nr:hypothetical protein AX17_007539 [Amanita inopinata Kibby_2008]
MASTAPPGAAQPPPQSTSSADVPLTWEGDKMFNIYIYDYCFKRGFKKTARELLQEADLPADAKPPINARQGLLFEWWSVFWVLFTAKANGNGSEEALLYTQHQANQVMQRQLQQQRMQPPSQGPLAGPPVGQPGGPQQPPVQRIMNGGPMAQRMNAPFSINGPMTNGVTSTPLQPGQLQPGPGPFPNMGGPGPQPNGIPGSGPPHTPGSTSVQPQTFQSLLPNQRPLGGPGGPQQSPQPPQPLQQQRQNGPFQQSPTIANSPQAIVPGQPQQQQQTTPQQQSQQALQHHAQPPMSQLGTPGPSPHMQHLNRSMPPPQGLNHMNPGVQQAGGTPSPSFAHLGRPPSRANTPGQAGMLQPSPSLSARQPPGSMIQDMAELRQIPQPILSMLKQELGIGDRDINQLTPAEKARLLATYRQRRGHKPDGTPGHSPAGMQPPNAQIRGLPQQPPQAQQQRMKRSSTSPEEHDARNDSPPQKRLRPSPEQPMQGMGYLPQQQPPGPPGGPQSGQPGIGMTQTSLMMMRAPNQLGGHMAGGIPPTGQPPMGNPMNMNMGQPPIGGPQLGVSLNPQHPVNHPGQPGIMNPQLPWQQQYRQLQSMQAIGKGPLPPQSGMSNPPMPGPGPGPGSTPVDPSMHPGGPQFNRLPPQNKLMGMMPPPSPAQNGANKDQSANKDIKVEETSRTVAGNAGHTPNASGTAPPTPVPGVTGAPTAQGPPATANGAPNPNIAPSPSSLLGAPLNPGSMVNQQAVLSDTLFPADFMQQLTNTLDDFDSNMFRNDSDINFERDFGQWFNGDDVPLDMK